MLTLNGLKETDVAPGGNCSFHFIFTCVGDLGRGGPGEMGRSMWLDPTSGLSGGLSSSGGDGVLASRSGPESLENQTEREDFCGDFYINWTKLIAWLVSDNIYTHFFDINQTI